MGFLDSIFGSGSQKSKSKSTSEVKLPEWVTNAGKANYQVAQNLANRPYTAYPGQRVAGFSDDQNIAMDMLRNYAPTAMNNASTPFSLPRLIDEIGPGGTVEAYMSPYTENVLDRTQQRIREATNMGRQWQSNASAHQAGAFGDARHGIADATIEAKGIQQMGDAAASGYDAAYNNAQGLRQHDIARMLDTRNMDRQQQADLLAYVDSLFRSGSNQQALDQRGMDVGFEEFLRSQNYPIEMFNLLSSALNQTPYGKTVNETSVTKTPTPSLASQLLGIGGNALSAYLGR